MTCEEPRAVYIHLMKYSDDDLLEEAIEHARDVAHTCREASRAMRYDRLAGWLEELRVKRNYRPLRCRLGFHKKSRVGAREMCLLCGKVWFSAAIDYHSESLIPSSLGTRYIKDFEEPVVLAKFNPKPSAASEPLAQEIRERMKAVRTKLDLDGSHVLLFKPAEKESNVTLDLLAARLREKGFLTLDLLAAELREKGFIVEVVGNYSTRSTLLRARFKVGSHPDVILLNPDRVVIERWQGDKHIPSAQEVVDAFYKNLTGDASAAP